MNIINSISFLLWVVFIVAYLLKLVILHKKFRIKALVLGKGNKGRSIDFSEVFVRITTFVWGTIWFFQSVGSRWIAAFLPNLFNSTIISHVGLCMILIGLLFFISSMVTMKTSWRVGIDKSTKTKLITEGLYKYSRNPAFVGFDFMFIGLFLTFPNVVTFIICFINMISIHLLIVQEEKHLEEMLEEEYVTYRRKTPRYLFF